MTTPRKITRVLDSIIALAAVLVLSAVTGLWRGTGRSSKGSQDNAWFYQKGHREGSINIPVGELAIRWPVEKMDLAGQKVVVDCTSTSWISCRRAGMILRDAGTENVLLLMPQGP